MLKKRVLSALTAIPPVLFLTWLGGFSFLVLILIVSTLALLELYRLLGVSEKRLRLCGLAGNAVLLPVLLLSGAEVYLAALLLFLLLTFTLYWFTYPADFQVLAAIWFGKLYITTMLGHILVIRAMPGGLWLVLLVLLAVWATDSGAFFFGMSLGRRRLAPLVSPNKSWEGALGGLVTALLVTCLVAPYLGFARLFALGLALVVSLAGQAGDMAESALKRWAQIKDSGSFLPGHGGVLDRLDSLLFALPVAYIYLIFFGGLGGY